MFTIEHNGITLRGAYDDNRVLWLPAEDVAKLRGTTRIAGWHLHKAGLRRGVDYQAIDVNSAMGVKLTLIGKRGNQRRLLLSESGMYMLMMKGQSYRDKQLQYWLADEVIPAIRAHGQYELPDGHPMYAVLKEVSDELKVYRDLVWERSDLKLSDLATISVDANGNRQIYASYPSDMDREMREIYREKLRELAHPEED